METEWNAADAPLTWRKWLWEQFIIVWLFGIYFQCMHEMELIEVYIFVVNAFEKWREIRRFRGILFDRGGSE